MRAVITGATGAVGMALISELTVRGIHATVICRHGSPRNVRIPCGELTEKIECSLDGLKTLELDGKYDVFFHLAWEGTTGAARNDMYMQNTNVRYTLDAAELAGRLGCKTFVGAGSQAEYGRTEQRLRSDTPAFPENGYGIAKLCAGQMSRVKCAQLGIRHVWARILSVYGEYDGENSLVMSTLRKLTKHERPSFTGGEQLWDYMYSRDAARAMIELAEHGRDGGVYCLGSGNARPLREYIELIRDAAAPEAELGFGEIPYAERQVMYLCADISELERDTGFVPSVSFEEGIRKTVEWYRREYEKDKYNGSLL